MNKELDSKCMYCGEPNGSYETYVVKKATKPKGVPYRWSKIGYCCEDCYSNGKQISIDNF